MSAPSATGRTGVVDGVIGAEVTIDGMLVIADRLQLSEFPAVLGIRPNIPLEELRIVVWEQVVRDLTEQAVLDPFGRPHPAVAAMADILSRPDRTLEARWWRPDIDRMVRFAVCRRGDEHVIAVRDGAMLVLQRVAPQVGLAGMVSTVLGPADAAEVDAITGVAAELAECRTEAQLIQRGVAPRTARRYAQIIGEPAGWVEITAGQRHPGGTSTRTDVAAGVLDSAWGRVVSLPRRVEREVFGSFLPGTPDNLQRALDALMGFLPARSWGDHPESAVPEPFH